VTTSRDYKVTFRLTQEELRELKAHITQGFVSLSALVRDAINSYIRSQKAVA